MARWVNAGNDKRRWFQPAVSGGDDIRGDPAGGKAGRRCGCVFRLPAMATVLTGKVGMSAMLVIAANSLLLT